MASRKDASVQIRLSTVEKQTLQKLALSYNTDASNIIRRLIMTAAGESALVNPNISETLSDLCFQLRAVGNNINQLTRAVNSGLAIDDEELASLLESLTITTNTLADLYAEMILTAKRRLQAGLNNG